MEYISREDYCEENCGKENREGYKICKNCGMLNIPSADVQPIKYTKNLSTFAFCDEFICKNCGIHLSEWVKLDVEDYEEFQFKFCPNCGARIDLKEGEKNDT